MKRFAVLLLIAATTSTTCTTTAQDTTLNYKVRVPNKYADFDSLLPVHYKGLVRPVDTLFFSAYQDAGGLQGFIVQAQKAAAVAVIDKNIVQTSMVTIEGNVQLQGRGRPVITSTLRNLFLLKAGVHEFTDFDVFQSAGCIAFQTETKRQLVFTNYLRRVNITGGSTAYGSSLGGVYDSAARKVVQWSGVIVEDCVIKSGWVSFNCFAQDGPAKFVRMRNVDFYTDTSHNMYVHPNVSLDLYNVRSMKAGKLALHHYSAGGGEPGQGGTSSDAVYVKIVKCASGPAGGMWEIAQPANGPDSTGALTVTRPAILDSCNLTLYDNPRPQMICTNTRFTGGPFTGACKNCSGLVRPVNGAAFTGSNFEEANVQEGGDVRFYESTVQKLYSVKPVPGQLPLNLLLYKTTAAVNFSGSTAGVHVTLAGGSPYPGVLWQYVLSPQNVTIK